VSLRNDKRNVLYLVAGISLVGAAFLAWDRGPQEPVYQGKALTEWINEAHDVGIFEQIEETKTAMLAFGTNAVPFLLKEFTRPISPGRDRIVAWVNSLPLFKIRLRTDEQRLIVAGRGLMLLETNAAPALAVLAPYLEDPNRDGFVMDIFYSLGDASLPYLIDGLASTNAVAITNALRTLQRMAYGSDRAQQAFSGALHHPSLIVRAAAARLREPENNSLSGPAAE